MCMAIDTHTPFTTIYQMPLVELIQWIKTANQVLKRRAEARKQAIQKAKRK